MVILKELHLQNIIFRLLKLEIDEEITLFIFLDIKFHGFGLLPRPALLALKV